MRTPSVRLSCLFSLLALIGCPSDEEVVDEPDCEEQIYGPDTDLDGWGDERVTIAACEAPPGWILQLGDCVDTDATIHPNGEELCDELDNNCNGSVDEGVTHFFHPDVDGDGFGDPTRTVEACFPPEGHVLNDDDCDDLDPELGEPRSWCNDFDGDGHGLEEGAELSCFEQPGMLSVCDDCNDFNAQVSPSAEERCNNDDDDCNGLIDDEAVNMRDYHPDADADGWGDSNITQLACASNRPQDWIQREGDCDDTDATVNPEAVEVCDGIDNDCDGIDTADLDGDNFDDVNCGGTDCDDTNALVRPNANEVCDGLDNNCDGVVDPPGISGSSWHYADTDLDLYGDSTVGLRLCATVAGWTTNRTDCDDTEPLAFPGNPEVCDAIDNDCAGGVDDVDDDGDGAAPLACGGGDCDDTDPNVGPSASEICDNGIDDDCDATDNGCELMGVVDVVVDSEESIVGPGSRYCGTRAYELGDLDGDGFAEWSLGCTGNYGGLYVRYGPNNTSPTFLQTTAGSLRTTAHGADGGDLDGDGLGDIALSSASHGVLDVMQGAPTGTLNTAQLYDLRFTGDKTQGMGHSVAIGDWDGDGDNDLAIGLYLDDGSATNAGAVYVHDGPFTYGGPDVDAVVAAAGTLQGELAYDFAGLRLENAGDLDADGSDDLLVAARQADGGAVDGGAVYVVSAAVAGTASLSTARARLLGSGAGDEAGWSMDGGVDVTGDGVPEILVGAPKEGTNGTLAGAAYLVDGSLTGDVDLATQSLAVFLGAAAGEEAGWSVAFAGDVNGDGDEDFLVGAPHAAGGGLDSGTAYLVYGPVSGTVDLATADAEIQGTSPNDLAGLIVVGVGDYNGDGFDDIVVTAPGYTTPSRGSGHLLLGSGGL